MLVLSGHIHFIGKEKERKNTRPERVHISQKFLSTISFHIKAFQGPINEACKPGIKVSKLLK